MMAQAIPVKTYTEEEANRALALVRPIVRDALAAWVCARDYAADLRNGAPGLTRDELAHRLRILRRHLAELRQLGIGGLHLNQPRIAFPTAERGKVLIWSPGQAAVTPVCVSATEVSG